MALIKAEDIARVKERASIEEVVREHVTLRSAGPGSLKGLCPFHDEKTPSFTVRPAVGAYHCFGCGAGGDVIKFVQEVDHLTFVEAVERLAAKAGVELRYEDGEAPQREPAGKRQRLVEAHRVAGELYAEALLAMPEARTGRDFLRAKGFGSKDCAIFGVGYAPRGGSVVADHLRSKGFSEEEIVTAGLATQTRRGVMDRFRGRVVWPIRDVTGPVGSRPTDLTWLAPLQSRRHCPLCLRDNPRLYPLSWRTGWTLCCTTHGVLLHDTRPGRRPDPDATPTPAHPDLLDVTRQLESIRSGRERFQRVPAPQGFLELKIATHVLADRSHSRGASPSIASIPIPYLAQVLPIALEAVQRPARDWPDAAQELLAGDPPGARIAAALERHDAINPFGLAHDITTIDDRGDNKLRRLGREIHLPPHLHLLRNEPRQWNARALPIVLPDKAFTPALHDYTPFLTHTQACTVAAQTAHLMTGIRLDGLPRSPTPPNQQPLRRAWWHLQATGQTDDYCQLVADITLPLIGMDPRTTRPTGAAVSLAG